MKRQQDGTKKKSNLSKERSIKGIITARICDCCGHHEIGIMTDKGEYLFLKSGIKVEVISEE